MFIQIRSLIFFYCKSNLLGVISASVDNLSPKQRFVGIKKPEVKPVQPPSVKPRINDSWQIDNGWKFMSKCLA